jgi:hypothetical protein
MPDRNDPRPVFDARMAIHLALTLVLAWLGFVLVLPGNTFDTTPAWRIFARSATEGEWAMMFFAGAIVGALGIDTRHRWLKLVSILLLATAHGTLAILFLVSNPTGGASGTFAVVAMLGYYLAWRRAHW